ncbi:MAG: hypothetical protein ABI944_02755 [Chthoniobacterales bacterium]
MPESTVPPPPAPDDDLAVPMQRVVRFVQQLSHDLRNHLNAVELQSAYLTEITGDDEVKSEVKRLRAMLSKLSGSLQKLTASLAQVKLTEMTYGAADLMEDLQRKVKAEFPEQASSVQWEVAVERAAVVEIDPQLLQEALLELFRNAFQHCRGEGKMRAAARVRDAFFSFTLTEAKKNFDKLTENWGAEPFESLSHNHYGLGLHRARGILLAHRGQLSARYDSATSSLVTEVVLPLSTGSL